jgi:hypothetical protein
MRRLYRYNGRVIGVTKCTRGAGVEQWVVAWEDGKSQHRIMSSRLPSCSTEAGCQKNLDAWARWKGLHEAWDGKLPEKKEKPQPGREIPPGGLEGGRQYFLKRRDQPNSPYRTVEYHGMEDGFHRFYVTGLAYTRPIHPLSPKAICHYEIRVAS